MEQRETSTSFRGLNFAPRRRGTFRRPLAIIISLIVFTVMWRYIPHDVLFWLMLPVIAVLVWLASYAWRTALNALISMLRRLENM